MHSATPDRLRRCEVLIVGPFPEPLHGLSFATHKMSEVLASLGIFVVRADVAPGRGSNALFRLIDISSRYASGLQKLFIFRNRSRPPVCYIGFSGGIRQAVDLVFISLARIFGWRIILHHHSFAYINSYSFLTSLVITVAGSKAVHIVLCERMADGLRSRYSKPLLCKPLSNVRLMPAVTKRSRRSGPPRIIGYLSNITIEKGFDQFLKIIESAQRAGLTVEGRVAGPFADTKSKQLFDAAKARGVLVHHEGPVYGDAKTNFFGEIDLFILPSRYVNEAEPFVIIESLAAGVPVISSNRGCIPDLINEKAGFILAEDDVASAVSIICKAHSNPDEFDRMRYGAKDLFDSLSISTEKNWQDIFRLFTVDLPLSFSSTRS